MLLTQFAVSFPLHPLLLIINYLSFSNFAPDLGFGLTQEAAL